MKTSILILIILLTFYCFGYAGITKEEYELQQRCGKRCEEVYKLGGNHVVNDIDSQTLNSYQNHYNKKLNKCFYLEIMTIIYFKDKQTSKLETLFDVNENKEYGNFYIMKDQTGKITFTLGNILGKKCDVPKEWESFLKQHMEE